MFYSFKYYAYDNAGNFSGFYEDKYAVDDESPIITIVEIKHLDKYAGVDISDLIDGSVLQVSPHTSIKLKGEDNYSGVNEFKYCSDGVSWNILNIGESFKISDLPDGATALHIKAIDNVGNESIEYIIPIQIDDIVTVANIDIDSGLDYDDPVSGNKYVLADNTYKFTLDSPDTFDTAKIYYNINDTGYKEYHFDDVFTIDNSGEIQNIKYKSVDNFGNWESEITYPVIIDDYAPITSIEIIGNSFDFHNGEPIIINNSTTFEMSAIDFHSGVKFHEYKIENENNEIVRGWPSRDLSPNGDETPFNLSAYNDGIYTIYYRSLDNLEQEESPNPLKVKLDSIPPDIYNVKYLPEIVYVNEEYNNELSISFNLNEPCYVTIRILRLDDSEVTKIIEDKLSMNDQYETTWDGKVGNMNVPDGDYKFLIEAKDVVGNEPIEDKEGLFAVSSDNSSIKIVNINVDNEYFSPNDDGIKDQITLSFNVLNVGEPSVSLNIIVYNKYWQYIDEIYSQENIVNGRYNITWNGKNNSSVVYDNNKYYFIIQVNSGTIPEPVIAAKEFILDNEVPQIRRIVMDNGAISSYYSYDSDVITKSMANIYIVEEVSECLTKLEINYINEAGLNVKKDIMEEEYKPGIIKKMILGRNQFGTPLDDGRYTLEFIVEDQAGNISLAHIREIIIDNYIPFIDEVSIFIDEVEVPVNNAKFSPNYPIGDDRSDTSIISFEVDENLDPTPFIKVNIYSDANCEEISLVRDLFNNNYLLNGNAVEIEWDGRGNNEVRLDDGIYYYKIEVIDHVNLNADVTIGTIEIDTTPPTTDGDFVISPDLISPINKDYIFDLANIYYIQPKEAWLVDKIYS